MEGGGRCEVGHVIYSVSVVVPPGRRESVKGEVLRVLSARRGGYCTLGGRWGCVWSRIRRGDGEGGYTFSAEEAKGVVSKG
jgi:hypothetical protein